MNKKITFVFISFYLLISLASYCQKWDEYQVYALKYLDGGKTLAKNMVVGANSKDSIDGTYMIWLLKGDNGRNILVDAGYLDTVKIRWKGYIRPDSLLERINVSPYDITDVIMTHPHYDHIGGINLFPKAKVWMQKDDFDYFVGEAWEDKETSKYYRKNDVRNIIEINLQGRLKLVKGDDIEIMPGIRVYIGSKHSFENMYLLVNSNSATNKIIIASDAVWLYYQLDNLLPATLCQDPAAYVAALKRMKTLVDNPDLIIPGHDNLVYSKFPKIAEGVVKIGY
jgi:glyoxylase-like metal-dependent hydrolase (beta-lactamase superfamily II)